MFFTRKSSSVTDGPNPVCLFSHDELIGENEKRSWGGRAGGSVNMDNDGRGEKGRWTEVGRRGGGIKYDTA